MESVNIKIYVFSIALKVQACNAMKAVVTGMIIVQGGIFDFGRKYEQRGLVKGSWGWIRRVLQVEFF
jgi:hypothetical protein